MATKLNKDIVRETEVEAEGRKIILTVTADQEISMKSKGMKTGHVIQPIKDLYTELTGGDVETPKPEKGVSVPVSNEKPTKKNPMILLSDLRSQNLISSLDYKDKVKFEGIITTLMQNI